MAIATTSKRLEKPISSGLRWCELGGASFGGVVVDEADGGWVGSAKLTVVTAALCSGTPSELVSKLVAVPGCTLPD